MNYVLIVLLLSSSGQPVEPPYLFPPMTMSEKECTTQKWLFEDSSFLEGIKKNKPNVASVVLSCDEVEIAK